MDSVPASTNGEHEASDRAQRPDLIILSRGGGSLEDLWEFNEEIVAHAIARSTIPVVTGIGHEIDVSIADLVADHHAHTPTEAAQVVTAFWRTAAELLDASSGRLRRGLLSLFQDAQHRFNAVRRHEFFRRPTDRINQLRQFLDDRQRSLQIAVSDRLRIATSRAAKVEALLARNHPQHLLELASERLSERARCFHGAMRSSIRHRQRQMDALERHLEAVSPRAVLRRGYSITSKKKGGAIVRSTADVKVGERLVTQFADGTVETTVEDQHQLSLFE